MEKADPECVEKVSDHIHSLLDVHIPLGIRIKFPLVWERLPGGIKIQDLHEDRYEEAIQHIKNVYMVDEPQCKSINIYEDTESVEAFSKIITSRMKDAQSVIALKEDENRIIGILVERLVENLIIKTMERMAIQEDANVLKLQRLRNHIFKKVDMNALFHTNRYNEIYIWSVEEEFRNQGIGTSLLNAAIRKTKLFKCNIICGIFTSDTAQSIAKRAEFQSVHEVLYSSWVENGEIVFENPGAKNYSATLMALYSEVEGDEESEKKSTQEENLHKKNENLPEDGKETETPQENKENETTQ